MQTQQVLCAGWCACGEQAEGQEGRCEGHQRCGESSSAGGGQATAERTHRAQPHTQEGYQAVKLLGRGMAGDTWLMRDKETAKLVAIKLFPRPIPDVQHEPTIREFQVPAGCQPARSSNACADWDTACCRHRQTWALAR